MKKIIIIYCLVSLVALFNMACSDDSYLVDEGTSNPVFEGTVWDFINSRPDYFDTLKCVVRLAGMEETLKDDNITFFAPPDRSILKSMDLLNMYLYTYLGRDSITDFSQIKPEIWKEFLSLYIVKDKYLLKDIPQVDTTALSAYGGQAYVSYSGRPMNIGVVYHDIKKGDDYVIKYAGYRQLLYSYIYDFTEYDMVNAYVATSDIQADNGVVHVLRFSSHSFGFNQSLFLSKVLSEGIVEEEQ